MRQRFYVNWKFKLFFCCLFVLYICIYVFNDLSSVFIVMTSFGIIYLFVIFGLLYIEVNERGIGLGNLIKFLKKFYCFMEWSEVEELRCWGTSRTMILICGNGKRIPIENYSNVPMILKLILENSNPKEIDKEILQMVNK